MNSSNYNTLHVVQHLSPGGIETIALDFAERLDNCFILSLEGNRAEAQAHWPRLLILNDKIVFADKQPGIDLGLAFRIKHLILQRNIHVVHTHHIGPMLYGGLGARLAGVKCIMHTHHDAWHLTNHKAARVTRLANRLVRPINVANAKGVANAVKRRAGCLSRTIYNGIDTQRFKPSSQSAARHLFKLDRTKTWIGTAGRLDEVKGQDLLLDALFRLPSNVCLAVAGAGPEARNLRYIAKNLGIQHRVKFLGLVNDMPSFYNALDVYCMPSRNEGFPLAPLEAQACGTPCVVTRVGSSIEAICPDTGISVAPNCSLALKQGIESQIARLSKLQSPRNFVTQDKDVNCMVGSYQDLARSFLTQGKIS